jgi:aryl-alcohol dehydrogenase-like predicted oxidoreductase
LSNRFPNWCILSAFATRQSSNAKRQLGNSDLHITALGIGAWATAWALNNPAVTAAIVGFRSAKQASGIVGAAEFRLLPSEMLEIENAAQKDAAT